MSPTVPRDWRNLHSVRFHQTSSLNPHVATCRPRSSQQHYYHPDMQGSWSIKKVLPTIVPGLSYDALEGVQHGGDAGAAYIKAIDVFADPKETETLGEYLRQYCALDTYAMVRIWQIFANRSDLKL